MHNYVVWDSQSDVVTSRDVTV